MCNWIWEENVGKYIERICIISKHYGLPREIQYHSHCYTIKWERGNGRRWGRDWMGPKHKFICMTHEHLGLYLLGERDTAETKQRNE